MHPRIESIHISPTASGPMHAVSEAKLVPGRGIEGDRYGFGAGTFSDYPRDHELTLVEAEVLESLQREHGACLGDGGSRRNLTTRGIRLNDLIGRRFRVGDVLCVGTRLAEPCAHLEKVTNRPGLIPLLAGRGGLRALILTEGAIRAGDVISVEPEPAMTPATPPAS